MRRLRGLRPGNSTRPSPFRVLLDGRFWRRHPAPYAKRMDGAARRAARLHKARQRAALLDSGPERDEGWFPLR